jgi:hypothetical protein
MKAPEKKTLESIFWGHWDQCGIRYYDRQGRPMSIADWVKSSEEKPDDRVVVSDTLFIRNGAFSTKKTCVVVSTVWLGLDHGHNFGTKEYRPLIFETMVLGGLNSDYQERYSTEQEAIEGHKRIVSACKKRQKLI